MIPASKFSEKTAVAAHEGTILGANVIPDGVEAPFRHFYGYLENGGAMAGHAHPTDEIYHIMLNNPSKFSRAKMAAISKRWHELHDDDVRGI